MIVDARQKAGEVIKEVPGKLASIEPNKVKLTKLARPELPWIAKGSTEDLVLHYKKLMKIQHDDDVGHMTSLCVGLAMVGCIDVEFYTDARARILQEIVDIVDLSIEEFVQNTGLDVDLKDPSEYDSISPYYCMYNTAILLTLIGKRLNDQNYRAFVFLFFF